MDTLMCIDYRLFQVGRHWVCKYLAIHRRSRQILEDNAFGHVHRGLGNILRKAHHLCRMVHEYPRMCPAEGNHLHQLLRYKASACHYKVLDTMMGMLCHRFPWAHQEVCRSLEVGIRSCPVLLGKTARWEHT